VGPGRRRAESIATGTVVLVPFRFSDLSGAKRRPGLVVSPVGLRQDDLIVCAITSQRSARLSPWDVAIEATDLLDQRLPRPSVILVAKLFTIHRGLVVARFGRLTPTKLAVVLARLRHLFGEI
jgi:mRNA interferase MazF